jgi:hypothetical protein
LPSPIFLPLSPVPETLGFPPFVMHCNPLIPGQTFQDPTTKGPS